MPHRAHHVPANSSFNGVTGGVHDSIVKPHPNAILPRLRSHLATAVTSSPIPARALATADNQIKLFLDVDEILALHERDVIDMMERRAIRERRGSGSDKQPGSNGVFGVPLRQVLMYAGTDIEPPVPLLVHACICELLARPPNPGGLTRPPPSTPSPAFRSSLLRLTYSFDSPPYLPPSAVIASASTHELCILLKVFVLALPEPVLSHVLAEGVWRWCVRPRSAAGAAAGSGKVSDDKNQLEDCPDDAEADSKRVDIASALVQLLPSTNLALLSFVMSFFSRYVSASSSEGPTAKDDRAQHFAGLARVFGSALFGFGKSDKRLDLGSVIEAGFTAAPPDPRATRTAVWFLQNWSDIQDRLPPSFRFPSRISHSNARSNAQNTESTKAEMPTERPPSHLFQGSYSPSPVSTSAVRFPASDHRTSIPNSKPYSNLPRPRPWSSSGLNMRIPDKGNIRGRQRSASTTIALPPHSQPIESPHAPNGYMNARQRNRAVSLGIGSMVAASSSGKGIAEQPTRPRSWLSPRADIPLSASPRIRFADDVGAAAGPSAVPSSPGTPQRGKGKEREHGYIVRAQDQEHSDVAGTHDSRRASMCRRKPVPVLGGVYNEGESVVIAPDPDDYHPDAADASPSPTASGDNENGHKYADMEFIHDEPDPCCHSSSSSVDSRRDNTDKGRVGNSLEDIEDLVNGQSHVALAREISSCSTPALDERLLDVTLPPLPALELEMEWSKSSTGSLDHHRTEGTRLHQRQDRSQMEAKECQPQRQMGLPDDSQTNASLRPEQGAISRPRSPSTYLPYARSRSGSSLSSLSASLSNTGNLLDLSMVSLPSQQEHAVDIEVGPVGLGIGAVAGEEGKSLSGRSHTRGEVELGDGRERQARLSEPQADMGTPRPAPVSPLPSEKTPTPNNAAPPSQSPTLSVSRSPSPPPSASASPTHLIPLPSPWSPPEVPSPGAPPVSVKDYFDSQGGLHSSPRSAASVAHSAAGPVCARGSSTAPSALATTSSRSPVPFADEPRAGGPVRVLTDADRAWAECARLRLELAGVRRERDEAREVLRQMRKVLKSKGGV